MEFKELLSESIVKELYEKREDNIAQRTEEEKEEIKDLLQANKNSYSDILIAIDNVPDGFIETRKLIEEGIEKHLEVVHCISGYDNEKFYKTGFCDAINLIIECLQNKQ